MKKLDNYELAGKYLLRLISFHIDAKRCKVSDPLARAQIAIDLVEQGASLTYVDWRGNCALHYAIMKNCPLTLAILMSSDQHKECWTIQNKQGQTPRDLLTQEFATSHRDDKKPCAALFDVYRRETPANLAELKEQLRVQKNQVELKHFGNKALQGMTLITRLFYTKSTYIAALNSRLQHETDNNIMKVLAWKLMLLAKTPRNNTRRLSQIFHEQNNDSLRNQFEKETQHVSIPQTHSERRLLTILNDNRSLLSSSTEKSLS